MEDAYRVVPCFDDDPSLSFIAIYDGHGGKWVSPDE
jgi:serine/threonine protein phosphatase PrpC